MMGRYNEQEKIQKKKNINHFPSELSFKQFRDLKKLLLTEIPDYITKILGTKACCMSLSWLVAECLNTYGIKCMAKRVECAFVNQYGMNYMARYGKEAFWKEHNNTYGKVGKLIWTVSLGSKEGGHIDPLHAVIVFKEGSILDMTSDQASRPEHKMVVKRYWATNKLPYNTLYFRFTETPINSGYIVELENCNDILNHVLKRIGETLEKPIKKGKICNANR